MRTGCCLPSFRLLWGGMPFWYRRIPDCFFLSRTNQSQSLVTPHWSGNKESEYASQKRKTKHENRWAPVVEISSPEEMVATDRSIMLLTAQLGGEQHDQLTAKLLRGISDTSCRP